MPRYDECKGEDVGTELMAFASLLRPQTTKSIRMVDDIVVKALRLRSIRIERFPQFIKVHLGLVVCRTK
jgi:hypothetical protein